MPAQRIKAQFVEPMLLLPASQLPEAQEWIYELKLDGYRAVAIKTEGKVQLRSRTNKDFNAKYPGVVNALPALTDETVIDGEIVALESGRPSFNALQNSGSSAVPIFYYVFDLLVLKGQNLMSEQLSKRRDLLRRYIVRKVKDPIRECPELSASLADVIRAVRAQGLEGVVAKNLN